MSSLRSVFTLVPVVAAVFTLSARTGRSGDVTGPIEPTVPLTHESAGDQDDLCFWRNDAHPELSLVITSDKKANLIAVYGLDGQLLQTCPVAKPGNIDQRPQVRLGDRELDIVAVNVRDGGQLALFEVNRTARRLERLDDGTLYTGPNYGVCLVHHRQSSRLDAVLTSESGAIRQFEISATAAGQPALRLVREWQIGKSEAAVADDESDSLYISEEERGVWRVDADSSRPGPGELVIRLGEHGLEPDLEGVALAGNLLLLSCQSQNRFYAYDRGDGHKFVGTFAVTGVQETDGIDAILLPCGPSYPHGVFGCHSAASKPCAVLLTPWERVASALHAEP